ncbi:MULTISPECIES: SDR family NAD(P)-dependent oxidoreductase [unclassified Nocardioides]|uniref:SDR family NAD(P)-dependent oxidoreductase n=1 Tax=unclassified Nocardioides TaxID=2615069 RepID=UPI0030143FD7
MDLDLIGRRAVVTGAGAGIGREIAHALAREGVSVALVARDEDRLCELARQIADAGAPEPIVVAADLVERETAALVRAEVERAWGGVDILVNNAGRADPPLAELDEDAWRASFELNFHAKRMLAEELRPLLAAGGRGRVVNLVGLLEPRGISAAQAAVAACILWAKGFSRAVAAEGTTVNCVAPGRIDSEQLRRHFPTVESRRAFAEEHIPVGRFGTPAEAAALVVFLCSGAASYLTGETVSVDGGMHRRA